MDDEKEAYYQRKYGHLSDWTGDSASYNRLMQQKYRLQHSRSGGLPVQNQNVTNLGDSFNNGGPTTTSSPQPQIITQNGNLSSLFGRSETSNERQTPSERQTTSSDHISGFDSRRTPAGTRTNNNHGNNQSNTTASPDDASTTQTPPLATSASSATNSSNQGSNGGQNDDNGQNNNQNNRGNSTPGGTPPSNPFAGRRIVTLLWNQMRATFSANDWVMLLLSLLPAKDADRVEITDFDAVYRAVFTYLKAVFDHQHRYTVPDSHTDFVKIAFYVTSIISTDGLSSHLEYIPVQPMQVTFVSFQPANPPAGQNDSDQMTPEDYARIQTLVAPIVIDALDGVQQNAQMENAKLIAAMNQQQSRNDAAMAAMMQQQQTLLQQQQIADQKSQAAMQAMAKSITKLSRSAVSFADADQQNAAAGQSSSPPPILAGQVFVPTAQHPQQQQPNILQHAQSMQNISQQPQNTATFVQSAQDLHQAAQAAPHHDDILARIKYLEHENELIQLRSQLRASKGALASRTVPISMNLPPPVKPPPFVDRNAPFDEQDQEHFDECSSHNSEIQYINRNRKDRVADCGSPAPAVHRLRKAESLAHLGSNMNLNPNRPPKFSMPLFKGTSTAVPVDEWLNNYRRKMEACGYTEDGDLIRYLTLYIDEAASTWYDKFLLDNAPMATLRWASVVTAICQRYQTTDKSIHLSAFQTMKQTVGEKLLDFANRLDAAFTKALPTTDRDSRNAHLVRQFMDNVDPMIKKRLQTRFAYEEGSPDFDKIKQFAAKYEMLNVYESMASIPTALSALPPQPSPVISPLQNPQSQEIFVAKTVVNSPQTYGYQQGQPPLSFPPATPQNSGQYYNQNQQQHSNWTGQSPGNNNNFPNYSSNSGSLACNQQNGQYYNNYQNSNTGGRRGNQGRGREWRVHEQTGHTYDDINEPIWQDWMGNEYCKMCKQHGHIRTFCPQQTPCNVEGCTRQYGHYNRRCPMLLCHDVAEAQQNFKNATAAASPAASQQQPTGNASGSLAQPQAKIRTIKVVNNEKETSEYRDIGSQLSELASKTTDQETKNILITAALALKVQMEKSTVVQETSIQPHPSPEIIIKIDGKQAQVTIDSGAQLSAISSHFYQQIHPEWKRECATACPIPVSTFQTSNPINTIGAEYVDLTFDTITIRHQILIIDDPNGTFTMLIGQDLNRKYQHTLCEFKKMIYYNAGALKGIELPLTYASKAASIEIIKTESSKTNNSKSENKKIDKNSKNFKSPATGDQVGEVVAPPRQHQSGNIRQYSGSKVPSISQMKINNSTSGNYRPLNQGKSKHQPNIGNSAASPMVHYQNFVKKHSRKKKKSISSPSNLDNWNQTSKLQLYSPHHQYGSLASNHMDVVGMASSQ